jgi:hypothetical protein
LTDDSHHLPLFFPNGRHLQAHLPQPLLLMLLPDGSVQQPPMLLLLLLLLLPDWSAIGYERSVRP